MTDVEIIKMSNAVSFNPAEEAISNEDLVSEVDGINGALNGVFPMKVRQPKSQLADPKGHDVTFNVTFAMAIPGVFTNVKSGDSFSTRNSSADIIKSGNQYFHVEFDLFDKDTHKEAYKTDIVFWGTFAKIYPDKSDSKAIPTWSDGEDTWICWIQRFTFRVSQPHISSLSNHNMTVRVWDTKDKCLPKTRFDRPKPPKATNRSRANSGVAGWIKETVMMMSHDFSSSAAFLEGPSRILPHQIVSSNLIKRTTDSAKIQRIKSAKSTTTSKSSAPSPDSVRRKQDALIICAEPRDDTDTNLGSYVQLEKLLETKSLQKTKQFETVTKKIPESQSIKLLETNQITRSESRKSTVLPAELDRYNKFGRITLEAHAADLFLFNHTVTRSKGSTSTLEDMFCMLSVEDELMSPDQRKAFNPLTITIKKIENLPCKNNDYSALNRLYMPLYCEYQFQGLESHKTVSRAHNHVVRFDDISVVLTGTLNPMKLKSQIQNSFLTIKLFDRIENPQQEVLDESESIGDIGDINITSSTPTITKITTNKARGEARIDLSDLSTKGLKYLEVMVPIVPVLDSTVKLDMEPLKKYQDDNGGSFLESGTTMKVSLKLAHRLNLSPEPSFENTFNRIVIVSNNNKCDFISKDVGMEIVRHNCSVLNFISDDIDAMQTFLFSTTKKITENDSLFSGVYIIDRKCEIVVIESLQKNIERLYEMCSTKLDRYQDRHSNDLKFLYNASLSSVESSNFQMLTMLPLMLSKELGFFVSQPLMYVRDVLPRECVEGICKLNDLVRTDSMHIALRNQLIPTKQMVESITQYLCSHITNEDDYETGDATSKHERKNETKIQRKEIKTAPSGERTKIRQTLKRAESHSSAQYIYPKQDCEFSYSCQTLNSVSSAKQVLRVALDPNRRYTYSQDYLFSGIFDPVDIEDAYKADEKMIKSEPRWITKEYRSAIKEATSSYTLPESRRDDLHNQWIENSLHKSFMEPTLPERDDSSHNFDLYIRPIKILNRDSTSIMPTYFEQKQTNQSRKQVDDEIWRRKLCVSDSRFRSHRLLPETEMTERGRLSSNQISRLEGLRKGEVKSMVKNDANKIPAVWVIPATKEVNRTYTVGPEKERNLLVNYVPVIDHDKDFNVVYRASKDQLIYKNPMNHKETRFMSPFWVYG